MLLSLGATGTYFGFQPRLLLPIFVLGVPALSEAIHQLVDRRLGEKWATGTVALLLLTLTLAEFSPRKGWRKIEAEHDRLMRVTQALDQKLPDDARLATIHGFLYNMLLDRPVYSLNWSSRIAPRGEGAAAVIDRYQIDHVLLDLKGERRRRLELLLVARYGEGESVAGVRLIRVRD